AYNFTGQKDHRKAFAAALRVPEYAQLAFVLLNRADGLYGIVNAKILMIPRQQLFRIGFSIIKQDKMFHQIQQAMLLANAPDGGLQAHQPALLFITYLLPLAVEGPGRSDRPHL